MKTYLRHRISNVVDVKELIAFEYLDFEGKYKDYSEAHDFWEICFVEKGEICLTADNVKQTLCENELFVISPNCRHSYHSEQGNSAQVFVACFEGFSHNLIPLSSERFSLNATEKECINRIISESSKTFFVNAQEALEIRDNALFGGQQAVILQLEFLLICLLRHLSDKKDSSVIFVDDKNFYRELTEAIMRYVRQNVNKRITLTEICSKFNYSPSFICKIFKSQTGETLIEYVNRVKIAEACKMLTKTQLKITDICLSLGFLETKYFDTLFKKFMGTTPTLYRKEREYGKDN